jgi:ABC-type branched-subunit amino acid transport system ATPase component
LYDRSIAISGAKLVEFTVVAASRYAPSQAPGALLQQDNWNDFGFQTLYHLYLFISDFEGRIGPVKILRRGQTPADMIQLPLGQLTPLGDDFCSLGQSLDYYERLAELAQPVRSEILTHLRDGLAFPDHAEKFFGESGWTESVLRDMDWETFRRDASVLLDRDYNRVAKLDLDIKFQVDGWADPLRLSFSGPSHWEYWGITEEQRLPERVAVITGRNGSGKSTLLARLARVLHASQVDRASKELTALGTIDPPGIGFTRVLNVAYSAFDAFQIPGLDEKERRQISEDLKRGTGRYHFCGLRDIARELEEGLLQSRLQPTDAGASTSDRQDRTILKSIDQLGDEFGRTIERISKSGRQQLFAEVVRILASDPSFRELGSELTSLTTADAGRLFAWWSTGHKIVMHAIASMVLYTEAKSIVLIDEPESHLHPPLLAAFMHALRLILSRNDAFAVIATHSPVVAQETLGRHVSVVRRNGDATTIKPPRIETYGESIGEITDEVFGLNSDATDFHRTLQQLVRHGMSLEAIESLFERGLSLQARAYVMSETARKK